MKVNNSLKILFLYNTVFVFAGSLFGPLYAIFVQKIVGDVATVAVTWAVFTATATIGTYIVSLFGDKVKEKEFLLMGGYLFRGIGWLGFLFAQNFYDILIIQLILGIGESVGTPSFEVIFAKHLDKSREIREYSIWKVLSNLVGSVGAISGGIVVTHYGFNTLFIGMSVLAFCSFFGVLLTPRKLL